MGVSTISLQQAPTTYRGYALDAFQREAILALQAGESVLVSAPTGTGKTLIADYLIDSVYQSGFQVIYTAPIKALSNQKYKEFKALLGEENVGILTGDIVRNPQGAVLIMTTEIFRNLLHTDRERLDATKYVIFDEIHYIDDPIRGSVWEESLIFMPPTMRFLGLSATIPNVDELANWIGRIQERPVRVITHTERAVPLESRLYERTLGECTFNQLAKRHRRYAARFGTTQSGTVAARFEPTRHVEVVQHIAPELLPCLFFTFSRRRCEANAKELLEFGDYLTPSEREEAADVVQKTIERYEGAGERSVMEMLPMLLRGIGYHHAGLLPAAKDVVEELFERRLIKVLYCTETFAVGLNFPCRTVCFDAVTKWDGQRFRPLSNREYFQMAGRAGRRGIDDCGFVYTAVDFNFFSPDQFPTMREEDVEPLKSRFALSYNTVLNLIKSYSPSEIQSVLSRNFATYQAESTKARLEDEKSELERVLSAGMDGFDQEEAVRLDRFLQAEKALRRAERRLEAAIASGERRAIKSSRQRRRRLEGELEKLRQDGCTDEKLERFRTRAREFRRASARLASVERALGELPSPDDFMTEFEDKRALLEAMDYVRDGALTARGLFASEINGNELLVTECYFRGVFHDWEEEAVCALAACMDYDPRKGEERVKHDAFDLSPVRRSVRLIEELEKTYLGRSVIEFNDHLAAAARRWAEGASFQESLSIAGIDEGDLVYGFRRAIDVLRQVRQAAKDDAHVGAKMTRCIDKMDRDEVSILL